MSETPETDAAIVASDGQWSFALRDKCQDLERRLNAAIRERDEARDQWRMSSACRELQSVAGELIAFIRINHLRDTFSQASTEDIDAALAPFIARLRSQVPDSQA